MSLSPDNMMDPTNSFLGRELLEEITPVVMVLTTNLAEDACQKNGLNFLEMLLPFSIFNRIDVPVRTANDQPYRLQMFKLRLFYSSDIHQRSYEDFICIFTLFTLVNPSKLEYKSKSFVSSIPRIFIKHDHIKRYSDDMDAEKKLKRVVVDASETSPNLQSDPPRLETILTKSESDYRPSWIQAFNKELIQTLSFSEHEAFDHPVACLLVVSSKDDQPISRFVDLFNTDKLPSLLNDGAMDPKILKHYLLLHDDQDGPTEKAMNILAEMRSTFGLYNCKLLCINSAQGADDGLRDNPWIHNKSHASHTQEIGGCLSINDLNGIKDFMQDFASKHIIPHMEQKIRILNQQVSATRKGFKNQIKNLWWRKGKEDAPEAANGPIYTFSSIESQIRILGDYAFMLRDYELALSNYRLLSTDYKLDKAWKRYAGVQEMMGLSFFMLDQSRKESEYCMETAFNTYMKLGSPGQRNATRCGLWWADMLKARGQYKDAAGIYFRISSEEPSLHAAVMLEQASYCYLFSKPPMLRKYGFHLVLAGNRYFKSNQREHAIRMYRSALSVYEGHAWNYISDHVHFNIGRWYAFLGISDVAIRHMMEVLACSHQSLATQDLFLREFFQTVEKTGKTFEVNKLQLPVIDMSSYRIIYEDHRTYASSSAANVKESLWQSLEEDMVPSTYTVRYNWLESQPKFSPLKKYNDSHVCVVGEAIKLDVELKNPLHTTISVSGISLICDFCVGSETTEFDRSSSATSFLEGELGEPPSCRDDTCRDLNTDSSSLIFPEVDLVLAGGETKRVQLSVTPISEGILKILGVRWKLSGLVGGYQFFEFATKRKQRRGKKGNTHSLSNDLNFIVIKGLPKLEGCISNLPEKAFEGDLRLLTLELRNQSEHSLKNMKMKISNPRFFIPGSLEDLNKGFPSCLEAHTSSGRKNAQPNVLESSNSLLFSFPSDTTIRGGTTFSWPLWFHTALPGKISLDISIYYEMENCSSDMIYRTLRMHYDVEVLPSLDVSFLITPSPSRLQEHMVRMDIINRTSSKSFFLQQLSCVGDQWEILPLPTYAFICPSQVLFAGQALSCFFKLKDRQKSSDKDCKLIAQGSDVLLGSEGRNDILIDISRSPLVEFHDQESHNQGMSVERSRSTIDFVLISKVQGDDSSLELEPPSKLLSHHVCHCSVSSNSPVWWLMDGPRTINHDFSSSFCEATLSMTIHNRSPIAVSVRIATFDSLPDTSHSSDAVQVLDSSENQGGWQDVPLVSELKGISDVPGAHARKPKSQSIAPFVWCASSSTQLNLDPECTIEVPLRICLFSPGTYDLSNYELHWKLQPADGELPNDLKRFSAGRSRGHPFYLTALQSPAVALE